LNCNDHTARSRNDQVLVDLRLFSRDWILKIVQALSDGCTMLCQFSQQHQSIPIPGRTHFQRAMPSSVGLWSGAFVESLLDNITLLQQAYWLIDQCPLGSAASYGVSLPIDRQYTADLLHFRTVQNNVLYANNSRGKFEAIVLHALVQIMNDLSKFSTDIIIFSAPEFGYFSLPEKFCPGSSLMPQKRNPCPFELIRAKAATLQGMLFQIFTIIHGLPSGYHRDFQETKRPLMQGLELTLQSLQVFFQIFSELTVNQAQCVAAFSNELFATDNVLTLVKTGVPFREAYTRIAKSLETVAMEDPTAHILAKTHLGATGNLGIELSLNRITQYQAWLDPHVSNSGSALLNTFLNL